MNAVRELINALRAALTWWITVAPWEQAIRVRFGKRVMLLEAGIHLRLPLFDRIYVQSIRRRTSALATQTLTTKDGKSLTMAVALSYRVVDLLRLYNTLHHAEGTISNTVQGAVGEYVYTHTLEECQPSTLATQVIALLDLGRYGLADVEITITTFVVVKTYRFLTGEGHSWDYGGFLDTSRPLSTAGFGGPPDG